MKSAIIYAIITLVFSVMVAIVIDSLGDDTPPPRSTPSSTSQPLPSFKVQ